MKQPPSWERAGQRAGRHLNRDTAPVIRGAAGRGRGVVVITKRFKLGQFETSIAVEKII